MLFSSGSQRVTADGVIGVSGKPVRVFFIEVQSGGTAGIAIFRNGAVVGADAVSQINGTINQGVARSYGEHGLLFPAGCFVDVDANVTYVTVEFSTEV